MCPKDHFADSLAVENVILLLEDFLPGNENLLLEKLLSGNRVVEQLFVKHFVVALLTEMEFVHKSHIDRYYLCVRKLFQRNLLHEKVFGLSLLAGNVFEGDAFVQNVLAEMGISGTISQKNVVVEKDFVGDFHKGNAPEILLERNLNFLLQYQFPKSIYLDRFFEGIFFAENWVVERFSRASKWIRGQVNNCF